ncbi:MAG: hypothetical protein ACYTDW_20890 [Planctomycetota bacterium]|jgi:hypothetical protein
MPANLIRQATFAPSANSTTGIIIKLSGSAQITVSQAQIDNLAAGEIQVALRTIAGRVDIFVHRNQDGTVALAIGAEPETWPEDIVPIGD